VGPGEEPDTVFIPKQSAGVELSEEAKGEIEFIYTVGSRKISNAMAVLEDPSKMDMIVEDLLPETGLTYIAGLSGTGKTILAIQIVSNLVLGRPTMTYQIAEKYKERHLRCLMLSLEMNRKQLQRRLEHMFPSLTDEEKKLFRENFLTYDDPETFELWNIAHILELAKIIKQCKIDVLLIDSASVSFASSLKDDAQVNESVKNLYRLRSRLNVAMFIVAHTRKPPPGIASNPEDATLNELFGHSGVAQSADGIVILVEDEKQRKATIKSGDQDQAEKLVHIVNAKNRFGANAGAFKSYLTSKAAVDKGEPLMFRRNAIPIAMTEDQRRKINKSPELDLTNIMANVDFGSPEMDGDD
jgi:KaiC/GvpD/RAD55 family RecA-like ATPase